MYNRHVKFGLKILNHLGKNVRKSGDFFDSHCTVTVVDVVVVGASPTQVSACTQSCDEGRLSAKVNGQQSSEEVKDWSSVIVLSLDSSLSVVSMSSLVSPLTVDDHSPCCSVLFT